MVNTKCRAKELHFFYSRNNRYPEQWDRGLSPNFMPRGPEPVHILARTNIMLNFVKKIFLKIYIFY